MRCGADPVQKVLPASGQTAPVNAAAGSAVPTAAPTAVMHDCSNDDSGLPLARLKVEQRWTSAAAREPWDITLVTQLSPGRRAASPAGRLLGCFTGRRATLVDMQLRRGCALPVVWQQPSKSFRCALAVSVLSFVALTLDGGWSLRRQALTELCRNWASVIAAAVYVPLLDGRPVTEPGAADGAAGAALADAVADLAALHGTIEQMGALPPLATGTDRASRAASTNCETSSFLGWIRGAF